MHQRTKWFPASVLLTACLYTLSTSVNVVTKTTAQQTEPEVSNETRDVDVIDMPSIMSDCNETFRTEMSYIDSLNESGSFPDETDRTAKVPMLQCFVRCLLERSGVMSEGGQLEAARAPAFFAAERAAGDGDDFRNSTYACVYRNETCICERSYQFVKCVTELELNKYGTLKAGGYEQPLPAARAI